MYEITKDNYKDIDFNGVIISVPRERLKHELTQDFCLHFECAYYTKGEHGYKEPGYSPDNSSFFSIWYGDEDMPNGFGFNSTSRLPWDEKYLHFNNVRYYKFKDMEEFCTWYLQNKNYEVWSYSSDNDLKGKIHNIEATSSINQDKEWIHEKCGTNTPPTSVPKHPSKGNKKSSSLDINQLNDEIAQNVLRRMIREALKEAVQKDKFKELHKINGEFIYWDIYCDKETTPEMREKIENIYPEFKKQYAKSYLQYDGNEYKTVKDIYTEDEIREKVNPGWKTRRQKYGELITLMDLYWNWVKECMKPGATVQDVQPAHTKLEEFLNGEANDYFG